MLSFTAQCVRSKCELSIPLLQVSDSCSRCMVCPSEVLTMCDDLECCCKTLSSQKEFRLLSQWNNSLHNPLKSWFVRLRGPLLLAKVNLISVPISFPRQSSPHPVPASGPVSGPAPVQSVDRPIPVPAPAPLSSSRSLVCKIDRTAPGPSRGNTADVFNSSTFDR